MYWEMGVCEEEAKVKGGHAVTMIPKCHFTV